MVQAKVKETYYISHGSPTLCINDSLPARHFLKSFRDTVYGGPPPTSILVISGHWETDHPTINAISGSCDTIHDFYGFPQEMYQLKYPAPGAPELATRVKEVLMASGYQKVSVDKKRGLDHGAWVPLMLMFPEADIPVCQLSVQTQRDGTYHYNLGKALAPLKEEGVLIIGSGSAVHNLRSLSRSAGSSVVPWALEFDTWLKDALLDGRYEDVNQYEERAPHAKVAHPWPDHFYPLHVVIGAAGENAKAELIHNSWELGTISYSSYKFTHRNHHPLLSQGGRYPHYWLWFCRSQLEGLSRSAGSFVAPWALEFDAWVKDALLHGRYEDVNLYEERAPHAKAAHPRPDHFYPLHVAIGAAGENAKAELIHNSWELGTLSYSSYKFAVT